MTKTNSVHLINPLQNADGGSEWRTLELYRLLSPVADVQIWASGTPDPRLPADYPVNLISVSSGMYPKGGVMVFVGCYFAAGDWVQHTRSDHTILIYNTNTLPDLTKRLLEISALGCRIELVAAAQWMLNELDAPGLVQTSPIDIDKFAPVNFNKFAPDRGKAEHPDAFYVGRLSRDIAAKHHGPDIELYKTLSANGCSIRIMGGTIWQDYLGDVAGVELLPTCAEPPEQFIRGLDCFYYRTHEQWTEPGGRVIMEAMACGVPVVAYRLGGYAEWIDHGRDGFVFDTPQQALQMIMALKQDAGLRASIGKAAREKMERMHGASARKKIADFYLR